MINCGYPVTQPNIPCNQQELARPAIINKPMSGQNGKKNKAQTFQ